jgi:type VI secretion system protein ImpD/type VI secretion system protein ImpC
MIAIAAASRPPLRIEMLSGCHAHPGNTETASALDCFLHDDRGALASWLGPEAAAAIRAEPHRLRGLIDRDIVALDALIATQLDAVLHHPRLQQLEGSWRGLLWMLRGFDPMMRLKTRLISVRWDELDRDLGRAGGFDQSSLFRLIYENEFGQAGGEPFGLLVVDHALRHRPSPRGAGAAAPVDDVSVVTSLSAIASAAFVPMVLGAAPSLFGVDRFEELALAQDVTAALDDDDHARWRALTHREDARFLCVALPRVLARPRWTTFPEHEGGLRYEEDAPTTGHRVWFAAGYAFAAAVGRAQATHNWPADVRGVATDRIGGGLVRALPEEAFMVGASSWWARPPLDLAFTDSQERSLAGAGLMPLNTLPFGDCAFTSVHSLQARTTDGAGRDPSGAVANRNLSAQINAILCVSRFAHCIKIIGRELTGSVSTAREIERRLQGWLSSYTNASQSPDADSRARHPLVSSRVTVHEHADKPGSFGCVIHLQPYYQLDDVSATFRLVTGFAAAGAAAR